jgi:hypothetical protein
MTLLKPMYFNLLDLAKEISLLIPSFLHGLFEVTFGPKKLYHLSRFLSPLDSTL